MEPSVIHNAGGFCAEIAKFQHVVDRIVLIIRK